MPVPAGIFSLRGDQLPVLRALAESADHHLALEMEILQVSDSDMQARLGAKRVDGAPDWEVETIRHEEQENREPILRLQESPLAPRRIDLDCWIHSVMSF